MKYVAYTEGVAIPSYAVIKELNDIKTECLHLSYPLFVKPIKAGDSLGIDDGSCVYNAKELNSKVLHILEEYGPLLVEEYIDGREFTVMVMANADDENPLPYLNLWNIFSLKERTSKLTL